MRQINQFDLEFMYACKRLAFVEKDHLQFMRELSDN